MVEIELKVRIDDPEGVKARLSTLGEYDGAYEKDDTYWVFKKNQGKNREKDAGTAYSPTISLPPPGLRVRRETNTQQDGGITKSNLVTYKIRDLRDGVEINDEREFKVSGGEFFEDLLRRLGLVPGIRKKKQGWAWRLGTLETAAGQEREIRAELSDVEGLGWFLELEVLIPEKNEETIRQGREKLLNFLVTLEIPPEKIEPQPYTEMLKRVRS